MKPRAREGIRVFFRDTSIRNKFLLVSCAVLLLSFSFLSVASYFTLQRDSMQRIQGENEAIVARSAEGIGQLFEYGLSISRLVAANTWVQEYYGVSTTRHTREQRALVKSFLNTIAMPHGSIRAMLLYDTQGQSVSSSGAVPPIPLSRDAFVRCLERLRSRRGSTVYDCRTRDGEWQVSLLKPVIHAQTGSIVAVLEIVYDPDTLLSLLNLSGAPARMAIVDGDGEALVRADPEIPLPGAEGMRELMAAPSGSARRFTAGRARQYAFLAPIADSGWQVFAAVPDSNISRQAHRQLRVILFIIILTLLISVLGSVVVSGSLTRPLRALERCMERVGQGDLNAKSKLSGKDEIGRMSNQFNAMLDRISGLIDQVSDERLAKQESQLLALQAQINPHFLYNTLSGISALISMGMQEDALWMTHALETFYKTSLSGGENIIPLEKELQNVKSYLDILRYRYGGSFDYRLACPEALHGYLITKLTLQPLVENAVHHGLRKRPVHGQLEILARLEGETLLISVTDNGPGISRDVAEHFRSRISSSYGLYNVDARIKLYFGPSYGLLIDTERTEGARITVCLPAVTSRSALALPGKEAAQG